MTLVSGRILKPEWEEAPMFVIFFPNRLPCTLDVCADSHASDLIRLSAGCGHCQLLLTDEEVLNLKLMGLKVSEVHLSSS
jgi:hypothetical protein